MAGASHFLEHLLFKGTETRHASEIAEAVESVGGDMNAFTAQEADRVLRARPGSALDARARDPLRHRVDTGAARRRGRVGAPGDPRRDPDARRHARRPRARPVRGRAVPRAPARSRDRRAAARRSPRCRGTRSPGTTREHYHPANVVVAAAGNLEHDEVVAMVERALPASRGDASTSRERRPTPAAASPIAVIERPLEQAHLVLGMRALRRDDPDRLRARRARPGAGRWDELAPLPGGAGARGLAYSVFSYRSAFEETGAFAVVLRHRAGTGRTRCWPCCAASSTGSSPTPA